MTVEDELLSKEEVEKLKQSIDDKIKRLSTYPRSKLRFEKERCRQILDRNIPMCISMHTKNILQTNSESRIVGQLKRLNIESIWKVLNLKLLSEIEKQLENN